MKRLALPLALPLALLVAACAGGTTATESGTTSDQDLTVLELKCGGEGATQFEVSPGFGGAILEGTLKMTDGTTSLFVCNPPSAGADSNLVVSCNERPQDHHPGRWHVDVTHDEAGKQNAHLDRGTAEPGEDLACASAGSDAPVLPYATIAPLIKNACSGCHGDQFDSLEKIKGARDIMVGLVTSGAMPRNRPTWKDSAEGKSVISFLTKSPELE